MIQWIKTNSKRLGMASIDGAIIALLTIGIQWLFNRDPIDIGMVFIYVTVGSHVGRGGFTS